MTYSLSVACRELEFLEHKGRGTEGLSIGLSMDHIVALKVLTHDKPHFMNMSLNEH